MYYENRSKSIFSRASEYIGIDDRFIKLFSSDVLDVLAYSEVWDIINIIRSSPGGGKTTLLRLFTPEVLLSIGDRKRRDDQTVDVLKKLQAINVFDAKLNPLVVGTLIPFTSEYSTISYLSIEPAQKSRIFFALLNVRVILSVLYSISKIKKLPFPDGLSAITISQDPSKVSFNPLRNISNGKEIYDWCCKNEEVICNEIDSIYLRPSNDIEKSSDLYCLDLLSPKNIMVAGEPLRERILVMFDDVHNLSTSQRKDFLNSMVNKRPSINVWVAERLQALSMDEIISEGNLTDRDFRLINLEQYWNSKYEKFEKFTKSIAQKRLSTITEGEPTSLTTYLAEEWDIEQNKIDEALSVVKQRIGKDFKGDQKYNTWIKSKEQISKELAEQLIEWRSLEILLYRDRGKQQQVLFDDPLDEAELEQRDGSDVRDAARLFLNKEHKFPYYYGTAKISRLSSSNIEQFLTICGKLFENIVVEHVKKISRNNQSQVQISTKKQEHYIKLLCEDRWRELDSRVPNAATIKQFINNIGDFCKEQTYTPNAWNSPGINGVAITMDERAFLKDVVLQDETHSYNGLAKCIATCIAYNLIDFRLNYKVKGKFMMVLYLNRLYCVRYGLPLANGKFKERKLSELNNWLLDKKQSKPLELGL
ncbi:ORC-CDC6 family AAA ATPase [Niabella hibiscisoli]|uniref:ORC-CDC6 family AAA ATPase n=1 Tax=Niabella hibiscisoli TaxID=1825928 RepID=UPI001F10C217|nr:hypothetical protein [Niabella hibiscisoli]MCH5717776.1 hypothetical protein [Niabella hibiscisoli]